MADKSINLEEALKEAINRLEHMKTVENKKSLEVKKAKESNKTLFLGKDNTTHVVFAESPPARGGIYEKVTLKRFNEMPQFKSVMFTNSIVTTEADLKQVQEISKEIIKTSPEIVGYSMLLSELLEMTLNTSKRIRLADVGEEVGFSSFAAGKIMKGEALLYSGKLVLLNGDPSSVKISPYIFRLANKQGVAQFAIVASEYRNFAGWIAHSPSVPYLEKNIDNFRGKIAAANFVSSWVWVKDLEILLPIYVATRDIESNEILGVDYNTETYWFSRGILPRLMDNYGLLIPIEDVIYKNTFKFTIYHPDFKFELSNTLSWNKMREEPEVSLEKHNYHFYYVESMKVIFVLDKKGFLELQQQKGLPEVRVEAQGYLTLNIMLKVADKSASILGKTFRQYLNKKNPFKIDLTNEKFALIFNCSLPQKVYQEGCENLKTNDIIKKFKAFKFRVKNKCSFLCGSQDVYSFSITLADCYDLAKKWNLMGNNSEAKIAAENKTSSSVAAKLKKNV